MAQSGQAATARSFDDGTGAGSAGTADAAPLLRNVDERCVWHWFDRTPQRQPTPGHVRQQRKA